MKHSDCTTLDIQKPAKPHRPVRSSDIPSKAEIEKRYARIEKLKRLGISNTTLDMDEDNHEDYEEDLDKLKASILIMQDREVPKDLERKIMEKNRQAVT